MLVIYFYSTLVEITLVTVESRDLGRKMCLGGFDDASNTIEKHLFRDPLFKIEESSVLFFQLLSAVEKAITTSFNGKMLLCQNDFSSVR